MNDTAWLARRFGRTDYLLMSNADLDALALAGTETVFEAGAHVFRQGNPSTAAYVVKSGRVELYRGGDHSPSVVSRLGHASVIGDIALFRGAPYHSSARAVGRVTALKLLREDLVPLLLARPVIALRWLIAGLDQLEATQRKVLRHRHRTVIEQVVDLLTDEADDRGRVAMSQAEIAALLGVSRQSVNGALGALRDRGAVITRYGEVQLLIPTSGESPPP